MSREPYNIVLAQLLIKIVSLAFLSMRLNEVTDASIKVLDGFIVVTSIINDLVPNQLENNRKSAWKHAIQGSAFMIVSFDGLKTFILNKDTMRNKIHKLTAIQGRQICFISLSTDGPFDHFHLRSKLQHRMKREQWLFPYHLFLPND